MFQLHTAQSGRARETFEIQKQQEHRREIYPDCVRARETFEIQRQQVRRREIYPDCVNGTSESAHMEREGVSEGDDRMAHAHACIPLSCTCSDRVRGRSHAHTVHLYTQGCMVDARGKVDVRGTDRCRSMSGGAREGDYRSRASHGFAHDNCGHDNCGHGVGGRIRTFSRCRDPDTARTFVPIAADPRHSQPETPWLNVEEAIVQGIPAHRSCVRGVMGTSLDPVVSEGHPKIRGPLAVLRAYCEGVVRSHGRALRGSPL